MNVELLGVFGDDRQIAETAWVSSNRGDPSDPERIRKLIKMLAEEGHETPFESVVTRWKIEAPQRIQVQLLRHRMASHNVASARYNHKFKEVYPFSEQAEQEGLEMRELMVLEELANSCLIQYNKLLENTKNHHNKKRIRELAAFALPQGVMSSQVMTINLRSLKNLIALRSSEHAQREIREIAENMKLYLRLETGLQHTVQYYFGGAE